MRTLALVLAGCALLGCSDDAVPAAGRAGGSGTGGAGGDGSTAIAWAPCPLEVDGTEDDAECATVALPVRSGEPGGKTIDVFVQRFRGAEGPPSTQLWLLQGGPGAAGNGWAPFVRALAALRPSYEFYMPDHRGTGRSNRLGCPDQEASDSAGNSAIVEAEWPACIAAVQAQWGADLDGFSSTEAARDVAALVELTREPEARVALYGASYGTTWGHRFLQLFPDAVDGVALDSTNWPDRTYEDYDALWDGVAHEVFDACGADASCSSYLGDDPWAALSDLYSALDSGHCPELVGIGLGPPLLRPVVAWSLAYSFLRAPGLALVHRVARCSPADQQAVVHYVNTLFGPDGLLAFTDPLFSPVLSQHILQSEVGRVPTTAAAKAFAETCTVCLGAGQTAAHADQWPRYPFPEELLSWAESDTPVLVMNGGMDPFAPTERLLASGAARAWSAPHQHVIGFAVSPHGVVSGTPTTTEGDPTCGIQLLLGFLDAPDTDLDLSCVEEVAPLSFAVPADNSEALFGTSDAWE